MGRNRLIAGSAGVTVTVLGLLHTHATDLTPPEGLRLPPAAALFPAGLALLIYAAPRGGRVRTGAVALCVLAAVALASASTLVVVATAALLVAAAAIRPGDPGRPGDARPEYAETLWQSMDEAVMVLDVNYRVIDVNRRWRELTGYDSAAEAPPPPLPGAGGDWLLSRADGTEVPVLATVAAIPDEAGAPRGYVATYVDIAERKRAEDALSDHAAELERGNAQLAAALAFKNDLTSMLTHDVAQPISSIASLAELLCADWADLPEDIRLELATKIDKNTRRLIKMMNDLQLLFRLDTGTVTARRVPVPLLEVVRAACAETAGAGQVEVTIDEDLSALADRGHLTIVVENLLRNAIAHGAAPVQVRAGRDGPETVRLEVRDSGPGIPDDLLPDLFGRFIRGAGLGLFIARHLVEANGGSMRYEHADPRGARLLVILETAPRG
ncbi:PAS domain-containing sensor histidine kinase [Actinoplanes sp. SE50/110]|uniref:PAS domain-containing sensor histidine kinase n=1 Tax=Actinoplanes sp. (strain ATCC 31044 / CBS 674.73 / SE50/110) TaxID=134676 RepID=UPI001E530362|nr:PAS domain-containing sensor histidine kinase [Actinoplanes sp. SE50/110]